MDCVTPNLESVVNRQYRRIGSSIYCHRVIGVTGVECDIDDIEIEIEPHPFFVIQLASVKQAKMIMHDLYYGEYTGA